MERVKELIDFIYGKNCSLNEACEKFSFSENDLTDEELNEINKVIFRCHKCGVWVTYKEFNILDEDSVCNACYDKWFEAEEEY